MLDASAGVVAALTAALWAPQILGTLVGAWVDRRPIKRRVMIGADLARGLTLLAVPLVPVTGQLSLPLLFAVSLVVGTAAVFFRTAYSTFFATLVNRADFLDANAMVNAGRSGSYVAGPAISGGLVQLLSAPIAVLADGPASPAATYRRDAGRHHRLHREQSSTPRVKSPPDAVHRRVPAWPDPGPGHCGPSRPSPSALSRLAGRTCSPAATAA